MPNKRNGGCPPLAADKGGDLNKTPNTFPSVIAQDHGERDRGRWLSPSSPGVRGGHGTSQDSYSRPGGFDTHPRHLDKELKPRSPNEEAIFRAIRNVLARYVVKGDSKDIDEVALKIWKVTRQR